MTCTGCGSPVEDDTEWGVVTWRGDVYCSVECTVSAERALVRRLSRARTDERP